MNNDNFKISIIKTFIIMILLLAISPDLICKALLKEFYIVCKDTKYTIVCDDELTEKLNNDYDFFGKVNNFDTIKSDSIIIVNDISNFLYCFVSTGSFIAFCTKQNEKYYMSEFHIFNYDSYLDEFQSGDINHDGNLEFAIVEGDEAGPTLYIYSYVKNIRKFQYVANCDDIGYALNDEKMITIKNGIVYLASSLGDPFSNKVRIGFLDYSRDETKEIFYKPLKTITLKKWKKFLDNTISKF